MSDFFGVLLRRALLPPTVRPRAPSRFEREGGVRDAPVTGQPSVVSAPASLEPNPPRSSRLPLARPAEVGEQGASNVVFEHAPAIVEIKPRMEPVVGRAPVDPPRAAGPAVVRVERLDAAPLPSSAATAPATPSSPAVKAQSEVAPVRLEVQRTERVERVERGERIAPVPSEPRGAVATSPAFGSVLAKLAPLVAPQRERELPVVREDRQREESRIEIHIGRIEVLSAAAVPERAAQPEPQRPRAQSLDAYLATRERTRQGRA